MMPHISSYLHFTVEETELSEVRQLVNGRGGKLRHPPPAGVPKRVLQEVWGDGDDVLGN